MIEEIYRAYKNSSGICTDTRNIKEGAVFFALKGPSFDANNFAIEALKLGCIAAIVDEPKREFALNSNVYLVEDVLDTLQRLANHHRNKLRIPIIGLTGSNGKTTTKELIKSVLEEQYECFATMGNLNNHIGVPLSILSINEKHEIAIIEMGANHRGEILQLCKISEPDYGLITNIGLAHLEGFGGEEGVYFGKKELFDWIIKKTGVLFVNASDPKVMRAAANHNIITYGNSGSFDYNGSLTSCHDFMEFEWWSSSEPENHNLIKTKLNGGFNLMNALAAVTVGSHFGVPPRKIKKGLESYEPSNNRSQTEHTDRGNTLIIDCYNANPSSMRAAIESFKSQKSSYKICIIGDMMELGHTAKDEHRSVLDQLMKSEFDSIFLVGSYFDDVFDSARDTASSFTTTAELASFLKTTPIQDATILLKGSRKMKLESLIDYL